MPGDSLQSVVQYLHRIIDVGPGAASDAELLERFATSRDESAFALLVYRHGPMILGICQRVLHHEHDSEDVFQATFLTLARRANSISKKDSLASWLYKVAFRIACRARGKTPMLTNQTMLDRQSEPDIDVIWRDLRPVLDQEIARLPQSQSRPIILCYLEGKTHEEAAALLGWPKGTVASRLSRGRDRLRQRLLKRGWTLSAAVMATVLAEKAAATAISGELVRSTVQAAVAYVGGTILSIKAATLAEGALQMMWYSKVKTVCVMILALLVTGGGVGWAMHVALAGGQGVQKADPPGDAKAEIAALKAEIAKLRTELDAATKKFKSQEGEPEAKIEVEKQRLSMYRGKPLVSWLLAYNDLDPAYRGEAIKVIGVFAENDKGLIPFLVNALKDDGTYPVTRIGRYDDSGPNPFGKGKRGGNAMRDGKGGEYTYEAWVSVGDDAKDVLASASHPVIPAVLELFDKKASRTALARAAYVLAQRKPDAKLVMPVLVKALKQDLDSTDKSRGSRELRESTCAALAKMGHDAKPALPVVAEAFLRTFQAIEKSETYLKLRVAQYTYYGGNVHVKMLRALVAIDPEIKGLLASSQVLEVARDPFGERYSNERLEEIETAWQKVREVVQKRYK